MIKKYCDLIIISIIWIISIISASSAIIRSQNLGLQIYISYILLIVLSLLKYFKVKRFNIYLAVFLFLSMIGLLQFSQYYMTSNFGLSFGKNGLTTIEFHTVFLVLILFYLIVNLSGITGILSDFFSEDYSVTVERQKRLTDTYYEELKKEKNEMLQNIIDNKNMYQKEYYRAAQKLLGERIHN